MYSIQNTYAKYYLHTRADFILFVYKYKHILIKSILKLSLLLLFFVTAENTMQAQESIYAAPTGTFYTHSGAQVGIFGNIINDASGGINHNNGGNVYLFRSAGTGAGNSRIYDGPSAPAFTGNYNSGGAYVRFYNWITDNSIGTNTPSGTLINTTSGQGRIQVEQEVRVSNLHTFTNGIVWTPRGNWKHAYVHYDANGASYTGNSDTRHIDGYAAKTGNSNFDFPIGDGVRQRMSGLSSPASGTYKSAYFKQNPQSGTTGLSGPSAGASPMTGGLLKISSREFWDIDGTASSQYKLTALNSVAGYSDWANDFVSYSAGDVVIAAWDAIWENLTISPVPASMAADGPFVSAANTVNPDAGNSWGTGQPFSAFTWGVATYPVPLSLKLLGFTATGSGCVANLSWTTTNEVNVDRFEVQQSINGVEFTTVAIVKAKNSTEVNTYVLQADQQLKLNYYRLKMVDENGQYAYSSVQQVKINCSASENYFAVYPNPVRNGQLYLNFKTDNTGEGSILVFTETGQRVMKKDILISSGNNKTGLDLKNLLKGNYIIHLLSANGTIIGQPQKIIIE